MTLGEWLATRTPAPPPSLAERLQLRIGEHHAQAGGETPRAPSEDGVAGYADEYVEVAAELLSDLLRNGCTGRDSAPDLLAADALVTYAFEAASEDPPSLERRAERAMARISRLATERNS